MKIKPDLKRRQQGIVLWILILIVVLFVVIIAGIAYVMIKTIIKLVPPQKDPDGQLYYPSMGSSYGGGRVIGYGPGSSQFSYQPGPVTGDYSLWICADNVPNPSEWTNCIYSTNWTDFYSMTNAISDLTISNLMQLDPESSNSPHRFYQVYYSTP
jgi:hypothetical protein